MLRTYTVILQIESNTSEWGRKLAEEAVLKIAQTPGVKCVRVEERDDGK